MKVSSLSSIKFQAAPKNLPQRKTSQVAPITAVGVGVVALGATLYYKPLISKSTQNQFVLNEKVEKLLECCRNLKPENYQVTSENLTNKVFRADLHSHTNHSDGWGRVPDILNQVAEYADELYAKTGEKFNFAITDHDRVSGVKEALDVIKSNPEKYKNINFVPGVELSFLFVSGGEVKAGEMLAYNINPDSPAIKMLVEDVSKNRLNMIDKCIEKLGKGFKRSDMNNYFLNEDGETFAYCLHYRLRNFAQIKARINKMAADWNENPDSLYKRLMDDYVFGNGRVPKPFISPDGFDGYLKQKNIQTNTPMIDKAVDEICESFYPKVVDGQVKAVTENSFEKIIDTLKNEEDVVLGFAHPYFTAERMVDFRKELDAMLKYSDGKIKLSENYHQAYPHNVPRDKVEEINSYLLEKGLVPLGGRDNHSPRFL